MILSGQNLVSVAKREVVVGDLSMVEVGPNSLLIKKYEVVPANKPGLFVLTASTEVYSPSFLVLVEFNPALLDIAEVSGPSILAPGPKDPIKAFVRPAEKATVAELAELPYFARLYIVDGKVRT